MPMIFVPHTFGGKSISSLAENIQNPDKAQFTNIAIDGVTNMWLFQILIRDNMLITLLFIINLSTSDVEVSKSSALSE